MEQLELKHLCNYLPYELLVQNKINYRIGELTVHNIQWAFLYQWKPLLLPLSEFQILMSGHEDWRSGTFHTAVHLDGDIKCLLYWEFELLIKHHFDVFGLIKKALALDKRDYEK